MGRTYHLLSGFQPVNILKSLSHIDLISPPCVQNAVSADGDQDLPEIRVWPFTLLLLPNSVSDKHLLSLIVSTLCSYSTSVDSTVLTLYT